MGRIVNRCTDWRFSSLFDRTITKACPAADSSSITVSRLDEAGRAALGGASWSVEGDKAKLEVTKGELLCSFFVSVV